MNHTFSQLLHTVFGGDFPTQPLTLTQTAARTVAMFVLGLAVMRLGKSRLMSRATAVDVVLGFVLGSLLSRGINGAASMSGTTVAMSTLVVLHWVLTAATCRSHRLGNLVKGYCHLLLADGRIMSDRLLHSHISEHDLLEALRLRANTDNLARVESAYKERSGEISFVLRDKTPKVIEIAVQPGVQTVRVELTGA